MKTIKKFGSLLMVFCMFFCVTTGTVLATVDVEPEIQAEDDGGFHIEPFDHYLIVDEAITPGGSSWTQPSGYHAYRVWVDNTTNETMTVTVKSSGGTFTKTVDANTSKTVLVVNNAHKVKHTINFQTKSGTVSGTVKVRVSDTDLSW